MSLKKNSTNYIKLEKENYYPKTLVITIGDTVPRTIDLSREYNLDLTNLSAISIAPVLASLKSPNLDLNWFEPPASSRRHLTKPIYLMR